MQARPVPSFVFDELRPMVTSADGAAPSTIENVALPPSSVVTSPELGVTVMPGLPRVEPFRLEADGR